MSSELSLDVASDVFGLDKEGESDSDGPAAEEQSPVRPVAKIVPASKQRGTPTSARAAASKSQTSSSSSRRHPFRVKVHHVEADAGDEEGEIHDDAAGAAAEGSAQAIDHGDADVFVVDSAAPEGADGEVKASATPAAAAKPKRPRARYFTPVDTSIKVRWC